MAGTWTILSPSSPSAEASRWTQRSSACMGTDQAIRRGLRRGKERGAGVEEGPQQPGEQSVKKGLVIVVWSYVL